MTWALASQTYSKRFQTMALRISALGGCIVAGGAACCAEAIAATTENPAANAAHVLVVVMWCTSGTF
jgi:hypothetical protein